MSVIEIKFCITGSLNSLEVEKFYNSHYLNGVEIYVHEASDPKFAGTNYYFQGRLPSCSSYFWFTGTAICSNGARGRKYIKTGGPSRGIYKIELRNEEKIPIFDIFRDLKKRSVTLSKADNAQLRRFSTWDIAQLEEFDFMSNDSELFRFEREFDLWEVFVYKYTSKGAGVTYNYDAIEKIRNMDIGTLQRAHNMLKQRPWNLCFDKFAHDQFGLKEMTYAAFDVYATKHKLQIDKKIVCALEFYDYMKARRKEWGDTLFYKSELAPNFQRLKPFYRDVFEDAFHFLFYLGTCPLDDDAFCKLSDYNVVNQILEKLDVISKSTKEPVTRQFKTPCLPRGELSEEQTVAAKHMAVNKLTLLQGGPGTGKSETGLVWMISHFKRPAICTFTGAMVNSGRIRMGNREEVMNTIHYFYCMSKMNSKDVQLWLRKFELIVVDEASNVDTLLFLKLLKALPEACKLIMLGDVNQIGPIHAGCVYRDLCEAFPQNVMHLTVNKRVDKDSAMLADAAMLINENRIEEIDFTKLSLAETSPIKSTLAMVPRPSNVKRLLQRIIHRPTPDELMQIHVVCMINKARVAINHAIEAILIENKIIDGNRILYERKRDKFKLFRNKKIVFTKNTKRVIFGDPVFNGEMGIVKNVVHNDEYNAPVLYLFNGKKILLDQGGGVSPFDIDSGYATTCHKSQGSEWDHVIFWVHEGATKSIHWTREFPYVAVSRAKKSCLVVSTIREFKHLTMRPARQRRTLLRYILKKEKSCLSEMRVLRDIEEAELTDPKTLRLMKPSQNAVPVLRSNNTPKKKRRTTKATI